MKSFLMAGMALASCALMAGTSQNFNTLEAGATELPSGWTGAGWSIEAKASDNMVLAFDGAVTNKNDESATAATWAKTAFLVKAPADATDTPSAEDVEGCQIAVATGGFADTAESLLRVLVYQGSNSGWVDTGLSVTTDSWFSVGLEFDYAHGKATVSVNGTTAVNSYDIVTSQATTGAKISSLVFVGTAKVDDVTIDEAASLSIADIANLRIYTNELGVTTEQITANNVVGESGLKLQEKLVTGLDPKDDSTFTATDITTSGSQTVITVPCAYDNGQVYQVQVTGVALDGTATSSTATATAGKITSGTRTLTFTIPTDRTEPVLKFTVQASAPSASN